MIPEDYTHIHNKSIYFNNQGYICKGTSRLRDAVIKEHICETAYRVKKMTSYRPMIGQYTL